jgi:hypothetical protein
MIRIYDVYIDRTCRPAPTIPIVMKGSTRTIGIQLYM